MIVFLNHPLNLLIVFFGTDKNPDAGITLDYVEDKYSHGYGRSVFCFKHLTEDDMLQPYTSKKKF